jgi:hypothetical protein
MDLTHPRIRPRPADQSNDDDASTEEAEEPGLSQSQSHGLQVRTPTQTPRVRGAVRDFGEAGRVPRRHSYPLPRAFRAEVLENEDGSPAPQDQLGMDVATCINCNSSILHASSDLGRFAITFERNGQRVVWTRME